MENELKGGWYIRGVINGIGSKLFMIQKIFDEPQINTTAEIKWLKVWRKKFNGKYSKNSKNLIIWNSKS